MVMKFEFRSYLEEGWSEGTVQCYLSAINTISNDLLRYKLIQNDIYDIDDINIINNLLKLSYQMPDFKKRNETGKRRYSNGIKRYIEFYNLTKSKTKRKSKKINSEISEFLDLSNADEFEKNLIDNVEEIDDISYKTSELERETIIKTRIGQSFYRKSLINKYKKCLVCGILDERFLIASHIKPWAESEINEKLDINNGLLLCVHHDALFDKNLISFTNTGDIIISNKVSKHTQQLLNINENIKLKLELNSNIKKYLEFHRKKLM